jgi:hypothetical protein
VEHNDQAIRSFDWHKFVVLSGMTAILFSGPAHGTLLGGLNPDGSFTYSPDHNFKGDDKFKYQAANTNGSSTVAEVRIKVRK